MSKERKITFISNLEPHKNGQMKYSNITIPECYSKSVPIKLPKQKPFFNMAVISIRQKHFTSKRERDCHKTKEHRRVDLTKSHQL